MSAKPKGGQRVRKGEAICLPPPPPSGQVHPTYQEGPKHGNGGQEVPDVMIIKEVKEDAVTVVFPGLCGGFLEKGQGQQPTDSAVARSGPTPPLNHSMAPPPCLTLTLQPTMTSSILCISLILRQTRLLFPAAGRRLGAQLPLREPNSTATLLSSDLRVLLPQVLYQTMPCSQATVAMADTPGPPCSTHTSMLQAFSDPVSGTVCAEATDQGMSDPAQCSGLRQAPTSVCFHIPASV